MFHRLRFGLAQGAVAAALLVALVGSSVSAPAMAASPSEDGASPDILGGDPVQPGTFLSIALVTNGRDTLCTGTLIAPSWVLTAAHCVDTFDSQRGLRVVVGRTDLNTRDGEVIAIAEVVIHPNYAGDVLDDIAMLRLARPSIQPIMPLMTTTEPLGINQEYRILGWGVSNWATRDTPDVLQIARAVPVNPHACAEMYPDDVYDVVSTLCVLGLQLRADNAVVSACFGDSGGPLLVQRNAGWMQVGVITFSPVGGSGQRPCGVWRGRVMPDIAMRVPHYAPWIAAILAGR